MDETKRSFPPVADERSRVLILGSLPGKRSLARQQYYAHPQNQFWRLIGAVIEQDLVALGYEARLEALLEAGVGLWDTVESAVRRGSLDGSIRNHRANALEQLVERLPQLRAVGFNGGKSAALGMPQLAGLEGIALVPLPSSSPAYTRPFGEKLERWLVLRQFLQRRSSVSKLGGA